MAAKLVWVVTFDRWDDDMDQFSTEVCGVYSNRSRARDSLPPAKVDWTDRAGKVHTTHELYRIESFILDF